jgi:hypothetical protein
LCSNISTTSKSIKVTKKSKNTDVQSKEINASKLLMKNLKTLKKMADKEGLSNSDILKLLKHE